MGWNLEPKVPRLVAEPHLVVLDKREYLAIGDGVHVADDQELLVVFHQERHVLAEERERRIGDNDIRLVEQRDALRRAEVAVALQLRQHVLLVLDKPFDVGKVNASVAVLVLHLGYDNLVRCFPSLLSFASSASLRLCVEILSKQVQLRIDDGACGVACRGKALQAQRVEVHREVLEEVAFVWVVAVAEDALPIEVRAVVLQLVLDELEVRVELVLLVPRRIVQIAVAVS